MAKLKAHEELSTNANTIKARNCVSNLTEDEKAVHLALKADHADLSYYLKKLYKSAKYKTRLQNELKVERICVRTEKGTHASCIANQKVKNISASSSPQAPPILTHSSFRSVEDPHQDPINTLGISRSGRPHQAR
ncbi:hypothetical protein VC83_08528 [Pseudogymnoascus destructans]|uniref:Uncharacterized protein n=1 Tax=Pseudogymnoascus destructans TaxID=655981 RepID=A0A176ZY92_9PEZI|nr:uncharacterized protein VC83_08528 [Pseudogymnoascus destructans]OAF55005.1 hypothetical protein VC83_08528 [Pseudogymnoascus destructans]